MLIIRKRYTAEEKTKIVLELLKGGLTQNQLTTKYGVHSTQLNNWKRQALSGMMNSFSEKQHRESENKNELVDELYKQIGQLKVELDWLKKKSELFK